MKIVVDMNLSPRWVATLASHGLRAEHWSEIGAPSAPDSEVLAYAREHECVVLTHDLDFGAMLAASGGEAPSVIQIRSGDVSPDVIGEQLARAIQAMQAELASGALITIEPGRMRVRVRVLPLGPLA